MNREYRAEDAVLEEGAAVEACEAKVLRRHVVMVLVDRIDLATARAIQYARALTPDDLHAVHFNIDHDRTDLLIERWQRLGLSRLPLDVIDCPDRRLGRAALELAAEQADGETEVSMVLPRRSYGKTWRRILHDQTADRIVEIVSQLPHVNATIIPFHVSAGLQEPSLELEHVLVPDANGTPRPEPTRAEEGRSRTTGLRRCPARNRSPRCSGAPGHASPDGSRRSACSRCRRCPTIECVVADDSGEAITFVFLGRRSIAGLRSGTQMVAEGMVGKHKGKLAMINPSYEVLVSALASEDA